MITDVSNLHGNPRCGCGLQDIILPGFQGTGRPCPLTEYMQQQGTPEASPTPLESAEEARQILPNSPSNFASAHSRYHLQEKEN
jgi:hypothetical protein